MGLLNSMPAQTLLNDKPARNPGQSLDEKINKIEGEAVNDAALLFALPIVLCLWEWGRILFDINPSPIIMTLVLLTISGFAFARMLKLRKELHNHRFGREGERVVGQYLNRLNLFGHRTIHDVVFNRGNIDHIIVSRKGVFSIETKSLRKTGKGDGNISFDGKNVLVNGNPLPRSPIPQAKGQASELTKFIKRRTGNKIHVQPVVVFPDWYVEEELSRDIWLLSHKRIRKKLDKLQDSLSQQEADQICGLLYEYVMDKVTT